MNDCNQTLEQIIQNKRSYFWDKGPLNPQKDRFVIIERFLEFGAKDEILIIVDYYGRESLKEVIRQSRSLSRKTVNYFALLLDIPLGETRCFSDASPPLWTPF